MAIIVDKEVARHSPCTCYVYDDGKQICYSIGAIGVLSDEQEKEFCKEKVVKGNLPPQMQKRMKIFAHAVEVCKDNYRQMGYDNYWDCISEHTEGS